MRLISFVSFVGVLFVFRALYNNVFLYLFFIIAVTTSNILFNYIYIFRGYYVATLLAACAVSIGGLIGFIGLIVPHFSRLLIGNDFKYIIPFSALIGALTLSSADLISRLGPIEIPVGIVTALLGAPVFMIILYNNTNYKK